MIPTHELRLQSMLRAMTEVLIPAIDPKQQLAIDQANIMVGNLRIMLDQHDKAYQFRMVELREYAALVRDLLKVVGEVKDRAAVESALSKAEPVAALPIPTQADLSDQVQAMKEAADRLVEAALASGSEEQRKAASHLVFGQSEKALLRERTWICKAGFEMDPAALPSVDEVVAV